MATSECNRGGELATALANVRRRGDPYYEAMLWGALKNLKDDREGLRKTHQRLWMFGL
jgi:hypothetical protein